MSLPAWRATACAVLAAAALLTGPARAVPQDAAWSLRGPDADPVPVKVIAGGNGPGAAAPFLYPAAGAGGLLVAVITHGLIAESTAAAERERLQAQADETLAPLRPVLATLAHRELLQRSLERVVWSTDKSLATAGAQSTGWLVSVEPAFAFTGDLRTLIMDSRLAFFPPRQADKPSYVTTVRVVAHGVEAPDAAAHWTAAEGAALKGQAAQMLAHAIELAIRDAARPAGPQAPFQTLRYMEGTLEKMERAQVLETLCQRHVMRTLRGWIMSAPRAPAQAAESGAACAGGAGTGWN